MPGAVRKYLQLHGKYLGDTYGSKGGLAAADNLTAKQRTARAHKAGKGNLDALTPAERTARSKKAAAARWGKKKAAKPKKKPA
jgi:hypothetical protein